MTRRGVLVFVAGFYLEGPARAMDRRVSEMLDLVGHAWRRLAKRDAGESKDLAPPNWGTDGTRVQNGVPRHRQSDAVAAIARTYLSARSPVAAR